MRADVWSSIGGRPGERRGVRGPKGRSQDLGSLGSEDFVEARNILGVTITDQGPGADVPDSKVTRDVPRLLSDPRRVWMRGHKAVGLSRPEQWCSRQALLRAWPADPG